MRQLFLSVIFCVTYCLPLAAQIEFQFSQQVFESGLDGITAVTFGPDGNLYYQEVDGDIFRSGINPDGTSTGRQQVFDAPAGQFFSIGLEFSPGATANNLEAFVSYSNSNTATTSNVGRLVLPSLGVTTPATSVDRTTLITGLTTGDPANGGGGHTTNQFAFNPNNPNQLFFNSGSNSGNGDNEAPLSAATLVADVSALTALSSPLDVSNGVSTTDPVQIYATGVRNAFDLVFHSSGELFTGINGNDGPSSTPDDPSTPANEAVGGPGNIVNPDETVARLTQGGFFGQPNNVREEFIPFGGNPDSEQTPFEVSQLPVGTQPNPLFNPDDNFNLIENRAPGSTGSVSPNGIAEFTANTGLQGDLLVALFGGDDLIQTIDVDEDGNFVGTTNVLRDENNDPLNFSFFDGTPGGPAGSPLDLVVDPTSGRIFVGLLRGNGTSGDIVLLTPLASVSTVPEPTAAVLIGLGGLLFTCRRRRLA